MEKTRPARVEDRATLLATVAAKSQREGEGASKRKRLLARYGAHAGETLIVWKEARSKVSRRKGLGDVALGAQFDPAPPPLHFAYAGQPHSTYQIWSGSIKSRRLKRAIADIRLRLICDADRQRPEGSGAAMGSLLSRDHDLGARTGGRHKKHGATMNKTLLVLMTGAALVAIVPPALAAGGDASATSPSVVATGANADSSPSEAAQPVGGLIKLAAASVTTGPPANAATAPTAAGAGDGYGTGFFQRFINYQAAELGKAASPIIDPNAPASRRSDYPPQPVTQPPYPFTEWPYGAATLLGVSRPNAVDSPLMVALAPSGIGKLMQDAHIQAYGWVEAGGNLSTNHIEGGNAPAGYDYNPNTVQLDQAVLYIERVPDTVQTDHIDWGFRLSGIYGVDYRYTTSYGLGSYQLTKYNKNYGWDVPMEYVEVYDPHIAKGLLIRAGRFISIPDIEAQLAPNNYMYSHSMTYTFDNFTNTGVMATLAATKNLFLQFGVVGGTDTLISNIGRHETNPYPNPLYPGTTFLKDPGAKPSVSGCVRYQSDSARDNIYLCADAINSGVWGYNNLQWYGGTYYHKFTDNFHIAVEIYNLHESDVPNANNTTVQQIVANGGTPFSGPDFRFNAPDLAQCKNAASLKCTASVQTELVYWNYQFSPLDNLTLRTEYYDDMQGQRTGVASGYEDVAVGVQHWLSPQIELRPEIAYYRADAGKAFGGNGNHGIAPNRQQETVLSGDIIVHF